jgi:multiple antibiotic resistance protein
MDQFLADLTNNVITLFVVINPIITIPFFQGITASATEKQRHMIAKRACIVALVLLLFFAFVGDWVLGVIGITLHYIMIAGGLFILIFAVKDALGSDQNDTPRISETKSRGLTERAAEKLAVVPIGIPLLAGPGAIATVLILNDSPLGVTTTVIAVILNSFIAWLLLRLSDKIVRVVGPSALGVLGKVMDILIAAIGIAFLLKGLNAAYGLSFVAGGQI